MKYPRCYRYSKRAMDLLGSVALLVLLSPVLAVVGLLVRLKLGRPVLFRQERAGLGGRPFHILKFRSMSDARDAQGRLLPDPERLPPLGAFLRRSSLDELPQLWNVVRGDMSLVGPRPLFMVYVPRYSAHQRRRLDVLPGITGLAQISGRINLDWEDRLNLDVDYVEHASLVTDLHILFRTLKKVAGQEDAAESGGNYNREFMGDVPDGVPQPPALEDPREGASPGPSSRSRG